MQNLCFIETYVFLRRIEDPYTYLDYTQLTPLSGVKWHVS